MENALPLLSGMNSDMKKNILLSKNSIQKVCTRCLPII